ncbi:hypothetical protein OZ411_01315 [Bradyrhizobium sp. Arg237L]|uniref:hypothetical protein n=1 Tax=Bradyrhizobium sp. Arg237L TaxID=3003352 RepID=UPI00249EACC1|nr:hypothetical protein [Bradyrhizobium sp. Arg237L]MDI4231452.1 hypothetical protein [Bradyrhizobium sp. Arg237L]
MASAEYWPVLSPILGAFVGATVVVFSRRYFEERAKNLATKHDLVDLQRQLRENTEITKKIEQVHAREDVLWRSELDYRERQLSELYGPAYGYVTTSQEIYDLWLEKKTPEINFKVKQLLTKQNEFMRDLLIRKAHLIEGAQMPESINRFATSTLIFDLYASPTEDGYVPEPLRSDPRTVYPENFDKHIIETTERLKKRIDQLHAKYSTSLQTELTADKVRSSS